MGYRRWAVWLHLRTELKAMVLMSLMDAHAISPDPPEIVSGALCPGCCFQF